MSPNKQKIKGSGFERQAVEILNEHVKNSQWYRISGSGAIGTIINEPLLMGDLKGVVQSFPKKFKGEAKVGYNSSKGKEVKQFTLKKEWIDKIRKEAECDYSIPFLIGKFSGAREGTKVFVVLDVNEFVELLNMYTELKEKVDNA